MHRTLAVVSALTLGALALSAVEGFARAAQSPEEDSKAAYEQVEGRAAGAGNVAPDAPAARFGLNAPPAATRPARMGRDVRANAPPPLAPVSAPPPRDSAIQRFADQGLNGILLSALLGLGIGGGFGYLTGRMGRRESEEA